MVKTITYKNQELPIRLSYRALKVLKGVDLKKLDAGEWDDKTFEDLLWAGLQSGYSAENKTLELKREDMEDVLDECFTEFITLIPKFFPKAETGNVIPNQESPAKESLEPSPAKEIEKSGMA